MKEASFSTVLTALADAGQAFPVKYISRFSDISTADLQAFKKTWQTVPVARKRTFLKKLNQTFDEDTRVSFDSVAASLLQDSDSEVRILALKLLEETENTRLIPPLVKILEKDPDVHARARAATVLSQFILVAEVGQLAEERQKMVEDSLIKAAQDDNPTLARAALETIGFSTRPEVEPLIRAAFSHVDPLWQATALFAAGRSADHQWNEQVITGLLSEDFPVRLAAVQAAGNLGLTIVRKQLIAMLEEEPEEEIFQAVIWSLSQIGGEDVRTYLQMLLDRTEDDDEIEFIEEAIANLGFTEDMAEFTMLALDPDGEISGEDDADA